MKNILTLITVFASITAFSQVGIGTTMPKATLDIVASNQITPQNNDGLLIPRVDAFPATNPTVNQNAMLVYLTTIDGTDIPGFYYWNNATTKWLPFGRVSDGWEITGNTGTTSGTNFLGTTDNQALDIRTNNVIRARFNTTGQIEILNTGGSVAIGENTGQNDDLSNRANVFIGKDIAPNLGTGAVNTFNVNGNIGIGDSPLNNINIGWDNVAIGRRVLENADNSMQNVAIGAFAAEDATSMNGLVAVGYKAAEAIHGASNTAIGYFALGGDDTVVGTAQNNTVVGNFAGTSNAFGDDNVTIGRFSDGANRSGNQNTILGTGAGVQFTTSPLVNNLNGRVLIGYSAGSQSTTSNKLYIENSSSVTPLVYGEFDNDILRVGGQLQIGSSDDTTAGAIYSFPTVDGTSGQALITDGAGNVSWGGASSSSDIDWYEEGTTTAPNAITDNLTTQGNVTITNTGDSVFTLAADSDNSGENDSPEIRLIQDGGDVSSVMLEGTAGNTLTGTAANSLLLLTRNGQSGAPIHLAANSVLGATVNTNGQLQLNQYSTATSYTGTATSILGIDANGNIIQEPLSAGGTDWSVSGNSGTTNGTNFLGTTDAQNLDIRTNNVIRHRFTQKGQLEFLNTAQSVLLGEGAGAAQDNSATRRNTLVGYEAGNDMTDSYNNTVLGWGTMDTAVANTNNNVAIGNTALGSMTDGAQNVVIGVQALGRVTTSNNNVVIGLNAMTNSNAGDDNVVIGKSAAANIDSGENVIIGSEADSFNSGAVGRNVIIGTRAGESGVSGIAGGTNYQGRVMIGYEAGGDSKTNNSLYIENSDSATPLIGGDFATDRVGINTDPTTLTHSFTVTGTAKITQLVNITPGTAPVTPAEGDVYYDSALKKLRVYTGAAWENLN